MRSIYILRSDRRSFENRLKMDHKLVFVGSPHERVAIYFGQTGCKFCQIWSPA